MTSGTRPDWDPYFMGFARAAAARATCDRKQVGAVIVVDDPELAGSQPRNNSAMRRTLAASARGRARATAARMVSIVNANMMPFRWPELPATPSLRGQGYGPELPIPPEFMFCNNSAAFIISPQITESC